MLELAAARLRFGGLYEGTTTHVLGEVLHVSPAHVKKAIGIPLALVPRLLQLDPRKSATTDRDGQHYDFAIGPWKTHI